MELIYSSPDKTRTLQQLFPKTNHRVTCNAIATRSGFCCIYGLFDCNPKPEGNPMKINCKVSKALAAAFLAKQTGIPTLYRFD
jgi:hypothetical protein